MGFIDNRKWLGTYHRPLLNVLLQQEEVEELSPVQVEPSRRGGLTAKMESDGKSKYIHSAYAPERDAKRLLSSFREEVSAPVLFIGTGLGYHIDAFVERYPRRRFAIYEPTEALFYQYVKHSKLSTYDAHKVIGIQAGGHPGRFIDQLMEQTKGQLQLVILPYYKEEQPALIEHIQRRVVQRMEERKSSLSVDLAFQQQWTLNATKNFPVVLDTPNFLYDIPHEEIKGKVAVIVAAGPSLDYEYDYLRQLLREKTAYVFAVGSAIHSLLAEDIHPHALFSYDPKSHNHKVVKSIKENNITDIPLVFGSSVGYKTIEDYPGDMLHVITTQDKVSLDFLKAEGEIPIVFDAPSIAVITLQTLLIAGFKKIIFVGQNLGFKEGYRHAKGVNFEGYEPTITDHEKKDLISVKDVHGQELLTNSMYLSMKEQLELHIRMAEKDVEFINTTRNGAAIEGAPYIPLEELIEKEYFSEEVNPEELLNRPTCYKKDAVIRNLENVKYKEEELSRAVEEAMAYLKQIALAVNMNQVKSLEEMFGVFDDKYKKVESNEYYKTFIQSMLRIQYEQLVDALKQIREESDLKFKGRVMVKLFNGYLNHVHNQQNFIRPYFLELIDRCFEEGD